MAGSGSRGNGNELYEILGVPKTAADADIKKVGAWSGLLVVSVWNRVSLRLAYAMCNVLVPSKRTRSASSKAKAMAF